MGTPTRRGSSVHSGDMATAFLVFGRLGVGKSTYARRLSEQERAVLFEGDRWVGLLYGREEGSFPDFGKALDKVEQVMYEVWARCLTLHVNVVLDLGFWSRAKRDRFRAQVERLGAAYELHEVVLDRDAARQRVMARNGDLTSPIEIGPAAFERLWGQIEPLQSDERRVIVHG